MISLLAIKISDYLLTGEWGFILLTNDGLKTVVKKISVNLLSV